MESVKASQVQLLGRLVELRPYVKMKISGWLQHM